MENEIKSSEVKTKNVTFGLVVSWVLGILFVLSGIGSIFSKPLNGVIFIISALIILPPINRFIKEKYNFSLSKGVKIVVIVVLLGVAGSQMETVSKPEVVKTEKAPESVPVQKIETLKVTAVQLAEDYKANEIAAEAKYKNKPLEISGLVGDIGKDILDTPYITFQTEQYAIINQVQCMFSKSDEQILASLSKGQRVTVTGEVSGKMGNILVKGCQIVN